MTRTPAVETARSRGEPCAPEAAIAASGAAAQCAADLGAADLGAADPGAADLSAQVETEPALTCPFCRDRAVDAGVRVRFARGFLITRQQGAKILIGCSVCLAGELRREAGRALLYGWFSPGALALNLVFIPWNFLRSFFIAPDAAQLAAMLREIGVPDARALARVDDVIYALAAGMIRADGRVDPAELAAIEAIGPRLVQNFDMRALRARLERAPPHTPVEELVGSVAPFLDAGGRETVMRAMLALAEADGAVDPAEERMLARVARGLGLDGPALARLRAETQAG
ncbi:MAG: TerB family tellurite resistance protein [Pseudomonadota bacterium]